MARTRITQRQLSKKEQQLKTAKSTLGDVSLLQSSAWFAALSNLSKPLSKFFREQANYFFSLSVLFSLAGWGLALAKYIASPNKNIKNTSKLAYQTLGLLTYAAIIAAFFVGGVALSGTVYYALSVIDPVVNLLKVAMYAFLMFKANTQEERKLFYNKCIKAAKHAAITGIVMLAMLTLFVVPGLPLALTVSLGIAGVAVTAGYALYSLGQRIYNAWQSRIGTANESDAKEACDMKAELSSTLDVSRAMIRRPPLYNNAFYRNGELRDLSLMNLTECVDKKIKRFGSVLKSPDFFMDVPKHQEKKQALEFLKAFLERLEQKDVPARGKIQIAGVQLRYENKEQLCEAIEQHVTSTYPKAAQSFMHYHSKVTQCFNDAFDLIDESRVVPSTLSR